MIANIQNTAALSLGRAGARGGVGDCPPPATPPLDLSFVVPLRATIIFGDGARRLHSVLFSAQAKAIATGQSDQMSGLGVGNPGLSGESA